MKPLAITSVLIELVTTGDRPRDSDLLRIPLRLTRHATDDEVALADQEWQRYQEIPGWERVTLNFYDDAMLVLDGLTMAELRDHFIDPVRAMIRNVGVRAEETRVEVNRKIKERQREIEDLGTEINRRIEDTPDLSDA